MFLSGVPAKAGTKSAMGVACGSGLPPSREHEKMIIWRAYALRRCKRRTLSIRRDAGRRSFAAPIAFTR
jgi:hypothetical protein